MLRVNKTICLGCGLCVRACPLEAISLVGGIAVIDRKRCNTCGACVEACRQGAITERAPTSSRELTALLDGLIAQADSLAAGRHGGRRR